MILTMANDRLLRAARREPVDRTPVWFMRQAGRFMPEYREIRRKHALLEICRNADLATEVTLLPIRLLPGIDAAILFSDLLLLLGPMGIQVEFVQSEGPVIVNPIRTRQDVEALRPVEPERDFKAPLDTIRAVRREIDVPLIGFAGAPFTLASYLIEGGPSRSFVKTKSLMTTAPALWADLMTRLARAVTAYLRAQVAAGAQILQLFDSWVGCLGPDDYRESVLPYSRMILGSGLGVPAIHFGTETGSLLELMKEAGGDVIGVDWRIPLDEAWRRVGDRAIQGNLDPATLLAPRPVLERRVDAILARAGGRPGHIFNLGHGVLPETPVESLVAVVERVHAR
jgi:uroporphyrinogen decarboxylase